MRHVKLMPMKRCWADSRPEEIVPWYAPRTQYTVMHVHVHVYSRKCLHICECSVGRLYACITCACTTCISLCLYMSLYVCMPVYLSAYMPTCICINMYTHLPIYLICLGIHTHIYVPNVINTTTEFIITYTVRISVRFFFQSPRSRLWKLYA